MPQIRACVLVDLLSDFESFISVNTTASHSKGLVTLRIIIELIQDNGNSSMADTTCIRDYKHTTSLWTLLGMELIALAVRITRRRTHLQCVAECRALAVAGVTPITVRLHRSSQILKFTQM